MAKWNLPEGKIYTQADMDAAVAAALREAVEAVRRQHSDPENENGIALAEAAILALIPDAGAALDRALAEERERCARLAEAHAAAIQEGMDGSDEETFCIQSYAAHNALEIAAAIRAQGD